MVIKIKLKREEKYVFLDHEVYESLNASQLFRDYKVFENLRQHSSGVRFFHCASLSVFFANENRKKEIEGNFNRIT